jgi:ribosomal protein L37AE/L43A
MQELYPIESSATSGMSTKKSRKAKRVFKECPQCHRRFLAKRANQVLDRKVCGNKYARLHPKQIAPAGMMLEPANAVPEPLIATEF